MVLDARIQKVKYHFGIFEADDWKSVRPEWILGLDDVGPVTLDHIRLYLAGRGITLEGDSTPEHWLQHLGQSRIGHTMGDPDEGQDRADVAPFTILVDSMEQHPFTFRGIAQDADRGGRPLIVPCEFRHLGTSMGDYSIDGYEGRAHVERKSAADATSTILGWGERRERFVRELENLSQMECSAVVIECTLGALVEFVRNSPPGRGRKTPDENAKIIYRQILAWQQDYRVPWIFCDSRQLAEITTFRTLERFWRKQNVKSQRSTHKERTIRHAQHAQETAQTVADQLTGAAAGNPTNGDDTAGATDAGSGIDYGRYKLAPANGNGSGRTAARAVAAGIGSRSVEPAPF